MGTMLSQIDHVIVVMFENRSFDTMFGWLYANGVPTILYSDSARSSGKHVDSVPLTTRLSHCCG